MPSSSGTQSRWGSAQLLPPTQPACTQINHPWGSQVRKAGAHAAAPCMRLCMDMSMGLRRGSPLHLRSMKTIYVAQFACCVWEGGGGEG